MATSTAANSSDTRMGTEDDVSAIMSVLKKQDGFLARRKREKVGRSVHCHVALKARVKRQQTRHREPA